MNFCEECGHSLSVGVRFCDSCGSPFDGEVDAKLRTVPACIVVINSAAWQVRWGAMKADRLNLELGRYLNERALQSGISYRLADLASLGSSPLIDDVIVQLSEEVQVVQQGGGNLRYFLLIGGGDDVPMAEYNFECDVDSDKTLATDHCYEILSTERFGFSVVENDVASLEHLPRGRFIAGRIPFGKDTEPQHLVGYFQRALAMHDHNEAESKVRSFGVSALIWQDASAHVANKGRIEKFETSPEHGPEEFQRSVESLQPDCLYFNLHGAYQAHVSGYLGEYPKDVSCEALNPQNLLVIRKDYVAVSEACYGARFWHPMGAGPYKTEQSVMLTALYSKCIGFLGASRMAWGSPSVPSLADITAMRFLENITSQGHWSRMPCSLGEAAYQARFAIPDSENPAEQILRIKNRLIFHLYGDPTLFHKPNARWKGIQGGADEVFLAEHKTADPEMPGDLVGQLSSRVDSLRQELRSEISGRIFRVSQQLRSEIQNHINQIVYGNYPGLSGVIPTQSCYRNEKAESFLLSYKGQSPLQEVLIICAADGTINATYERK
jgi:hypothetical protein